MSIHSEHDFQAESDLRTLRESDNIRGDNDRMARAKTFAHEQVKELQTETHTRESDLEKGFTRLGGLNTNG